MGPLHKQKWDDPISSVGDYRGTTEIKTAGMFKGKKCCWEAKDGSPASTALKQLLPKINELFQVSGNRVPDSAMVLMDIFMLGEVAEESVPYIMFSCPDTCKRARIEAMNLVRRSGLLKEFPGLKVFHWEFPPHIPDPELTLGADTRLNRSGPNRTDNPEKPSHDSTALEIFLSATRNGEIDTSATQKCQIGAFVRFGKCALYFTAAHVLLMDQDEEEQRQSQDGNLNDLAGRESDYFSEDDSAYESEDSDGFFEYPGLSQHNTLSPAQDATISGPDSLCHTPSLSPELESCTRPSQCDDASVIPKSSKTPKAMNEVFFKSHELDFILLDLSNIKIPICNVPELKASTVSTIRAGSTQVVAWAGSGRKIKGKMSGRPSYIRFPHGGTYQEVFPVVFEADIQVGDSGTMIRDAENGEIYGHIVVASIASRTAFIVPATKVLRAIPWLTPTASPVYTRLNYDSGQFRLIRLLPVSSSGDGISCELTLACLRDRPKYEVLSYVRRQQEDLRPILLNGQPWNLGSSIAVALRRLRYDTMDRYLWIDALCIDHNDLEETSSQFRLRRRICGKSRRCLIWLSDVNHGPSSSTEWIFSFTRPSLSQPSHSPSAHAISQQDAQLAFGLMGQFGNLEKHKQASSDDTFRVFINSESQKALGKLMALPWWKQFWPFQDAIVTRAATLICGTMSMDLDTVGEHAFILRKYLRQRAWHRRSDGLDFDILIPFLHIVGRLHRFRHYRVPNDFTFAMEALRDLTCSNPQHKILALLHYFYDVEIAHGTDFSSPMDQICKEITVRQFLSTNTLFPLARTTEVGRNTSLPSWVPDWSASIGNTSNFYSELSFLMSWKTFDASSGKTAIIRVSDHTLLAQGLLIDRVSSTYGIMEPGIDSDQVIPKLASHLDGNSLSQLSTLHSKGKIGQPVGAATFKDGTRGVNSHNLWRLLTGDIRIGEHDEMEWRRARDSDRQDCLWEYHKGLLGHGVRGKRLFSTKLRYCGLGPPGMKVGDVVVVLYGGRFPFILRPTANQDYHLVGYAYVSGIMDGEAVSGSQESQTFQIV